MMNHIDEGLFLLDLLGASEDTRRAYALHPLIQACTQVSFATNLMSITTSGRRRFSGVLPNSGRSRG
jgi:hypothetical protein